MPRSHSTVKLSRDIPPPLPWSQQLVFLSTLRSWHCIPSFDCSSPPIFSPPPPPGVSRIRPPLKSVTNSGLGGECYENCILWSWFPSLSSPTPPYFITLSVLQMSGDILSSVRTKKDRFYRDEVAVLWHWPWIIRVQWRRLYKPLILGAEVNDAARLVC